jgi:hypothetical protein
MSRQVAELTERIDVLEETVAEHVEWDTTAGSVQTQAVHIYTAEDRREQRIDTALSTILAEYRDGETQR